MLYLCITVRDTALCWQMAKHYCRIPPRARVEPVVFDSKLSDVYI